MFSPFVAALATRYRKIMSASSPSENQIAEMAYFIYQTRGCPNGRDMEHWIEAETQLMDLYNSYFNVELFEALRPEFWSNGVVC